MNTVDQAAQLADEGLGYAPDVVLLGYVLNDSEDARPRRRAAPRTGCARARRGRAWSTARRSSAWCAAALWATAENRRRIAGYRSMYADGRAGLDRRAARR